MPENEATFDRDKLKATATKMRDTADEIEKTVNEKQEALHAKVEEETSVNTRDGNPSPIYAEIIEALGTSVEGGKTKVTQLCDILRSDADNLDKVAADSAAADDEGAAGVDNNSDPAI